MYNHNKHEEFRYCHADTYFNHYFYDLGINFKRLWSDQSLRCALSEKLRAKGFFMWTAKALIRLVDAQADLSLRWAHRSNMLVLSCGGSNLYIMYRRKSEYLSIPEK